jgi:hypothetical protein
MGMKRYQWALLLAGAPIVLLASGITAGRLLAPGEEVLTMNFLLMYLLGLGSVVAVVFVLDRAA